MADKHIILTSRGLNCKTGRETANEALAICPGENYTEFPIWNPDCSDNSKLLLRERSLR